MKCVLTERIVPIPAQSDTVSITMMIIRAAFFILSSCILYCHAGPKRKDEEQKYDKFLLNILPYLSSQTRRENFVQKTLTEIAHFVIC